jgi:ribosome-associated protein
LADEIESSLRLARRCAEILDSKKLADISIFHVTEAIQITDYFVLASGLHPRQIRAAADGLVDELEKEGTARRGVEGYAEGKWLLLDFSDVVVHLFMAEQRQYYDLELLWGDSPRVEWRVGQHPVASGG